ncbi:hypothetical protein [Streptomyces sp. NPDC059564]|uniref:hypothetical protein n=1 Tax=Streptomyces sp. NPDC059564 TaxID=3346865 RepID=UPI0036A5B90E
MQIHTLMELVRENGLAAGLVIIGLVVLVPPLTKAVRREVVAYWAPKVTTARARIARRVAPKESAPPVETRREEVVQIRDRV